MDRLQRALAQYAEEVAGLAGATSTNEATFYPALQTLLTDLLKESRLSFEVRTSTSERRTGGGTDLPDLAIYEKTGDYAAVVGEVKTPREDLAELAMSTERQNQIGRYLRQTRVMLLSNVRAFGLLTIAPGTTGAGPVLPADRRLLDIVEVWPSASALENGVAPLPGAAAKLAELVETAVTEFATITEPESLARILARQARRAKAALPAKFSQAVQPLLEDFAKALGLQFEGSEGEEFLRSSLIQTAFYGLFAAWTLWRHSKEKRPFRWEDLADYLKIPFLGELFHEFRHPKRLKELGLATHLDQAQATLGRVVQETFFARFVMPGVRPEHGFRRETASNAILYFYEPFLEAFDPELRKQLGVWYTPQEIVTYQVQKVDRLLRDELGCERGFADERVIVLDPCCGTGAYLIEVLRCVALQLETEGAGDLLGRQLLDAFCHRILGFEVLTAPFVVAQLQAYLILSDLGVEPDSSHRPAIFLTNALTGWEGPEQLKLQFPELQDEHDAARRVKREEKIIVILGNPPYNRFAGVPPLPEESDLADHYKGIRRDAKGKQTGKSELFSRFGIRKHLLDDLYIRFFRLAEVRIGERAEHGVVSFISNYSFLTGRSHPLMRESLLKTFDDIWIDSLNGDKYRTGKVIPEGLPGAGDSDQSVFSTEQDSRGIQVGAAITTLLKRHKNDQVQGPATVHFRDFWGLSAAKRQALLAAPSLDSLPAAKRKRLAGSPEGPRKYETIVPVERNRWKLVPRTVTGGFEDWPSLDELFPVMFQGVNPNRGLEGSLIDTDPELLAGRMRDYYSDMKFSRLRELHPALCEQRARYEPEEVRIRLRKESAFREERIAPYLLFPLDLRSIYYETEGKLLNERRQGLWENLEDNVFLLTVPQARQVSEVRPLSATTLFDLHVHDRGSLGFPLRIRRADRPRTLFSDPPVNGTREANLAEDAWRALKETWSLTGTIGDDEALRIVRTLFSLTLALAHAPQYESDHKDTLAQDWIHLPIPKDRALFEEIGRLGETVGTLLDPAAGASKVLRTLLGSSQRTLAVVASRDGKAVRDSDLVVAYSFFGAAQGAWRERRPQQDEAFETAWGEATGDLHLNDKVSLRNVPERVWRYELGGYPVIKKWLGYRDAGHRPGQPLTLAELQHLREMVHRISALLLLHSELDTAYERALKDPFTADELRLR